jgi:hypothetical protein
LDPELYRSACVRRNLPHRRFHRILRESLSREVGSRLARPSQASRQHPGPPGLGLEAGERGCTRLAPDAVALEVLANPLVPVSATRERCRTGEGEPLVIDVADALECLERVGPVGVLYPGLRQPVVDLAARAVAVAQRRRGDLDRVRR